MKVLTKPDEAAFVAHRKYFRCPLEAICVPIC